MNFNPQGRRLLRNLPDGPLRVRHLGSSWAPVLFNQKERRKEKRNGCGDVCCCFGECGIDIIFLMNLTYDSEARESRKTHNEHAIDHFVVVICVQLQRTWCWGKNRADG